MESVRTVIGIEWAVLGGWVGLVQQGAWEVWEAVLDEWMGY